MNHTRVKYPGSAPGADTNTYTLFSTVSAAGGGNQLPQTGMSKLSLDLKYTAPCALKTYKSQDRGTNWLQIAEHILLTPFSTQTYQREFLVGDYADYKLDLVNGGTAQSTFAVDMSLSSGKAKPLAPLDFVYWTDAAMGADVTGDWVDCQEAKQVSWNLSWASTPNGDLYIQGTNDPARAAANVVNLTPPVGSLHTTLSAGTMVISGSRYLLTGATGAAVINVTEPMRWMRLFWDRSSSGSSSLDGYVSTRYE